MSQIVFKQGANTGMTTTRQYDKLDRLLSISSATNSAPAPLSASAYQYNSANQRTRLVTADGSCWVYQYDQLGQVISGKKYYPPGVKKTISYVQPSVFDMLAGANPASAMDGWAE